MSTQINTTPVRIESAKRKITQRLFKNNIPGSNRNPIDSLGFNGLTINVKGYARTSDDYDTIVSEIFAAPIKLYLRDDWYYNGVLEDFNVPTLESENYFPFNMKIACEEPYMYSDDEITRTKTITTNNQEWSADDDGYDIITNGTVNTSPDIKVIGNAQSFILSILNTYDAPAEYILGLTWDGSNIWSCDSSATDKIYKHNTDMTVNTEYAAPGTHPCGLTWDGSNIWSCDSVSLKFYKHNTDMTVNTEYAAIGLSPNGLTWDGSNIWSCDAQTDKIYKHNTDMTVNTEYAAPGTRPCGLTWDGSNIWSGDSDTEYIYRHNADMTVNNTSDSPSIDYSGLTWDGSNICSCDSTTNKIYKLIKEYTNIDVNIYNLANTSIQCRAGNDIIYTAEHRINADGSGSIQYADTFSTDKWYDSSTHYVVTHDTVDDELDIADGGYIYYCIDTKYPITGIPTLTAQINITAGIPTIQISTDAATWYDIDTAIVDDVSTEYELNNATSLSLKGETSFYFRIDCDGTGTVTCSIKSFTLDVDIVAIDAERIVINTGAANTIRCDQDSDSGMNCEVSLIYHDRKWT